MTTLISANDGAQSGASLPPRTCSASVLDVCCGSRMFWFDRQDSRAIYADKRRETHVLPDVSSRGGSRTCSCQQRIKEAINSEPSGGHDYVDEVLGLLRVARQQRDDYEKLWLQSKQQNDRTELPPPDSDGGSRKEQSK